MSREKWTNMTVYEQEIITLHEAGKTRQETAKELGLRPRQIKDFLYRYNRCVRQVKMLAKGPQKG